MPHDDLSDRNVSLPRIAIISSERYPHHDTNTQQVIKNASAMDSVGIPVELIIPLQKKSLLDRSYSTADAIYQYYNVPRQLRIREVFNVPASDLRLEKFFHSFFATIQSVLNGKVDIIYTRNRFAALLAFFLGKKIIFETYRRLGDEHPRAMRWLAKKAASDRFAGMVLHSNVAQESMLKAGFPKDKLLVLHNGFDRDDMRPVRTREAARQKLGLPLEEQYIVYTGNMQKNKCIESLIDIAAKLPEVKFLIVGGREEDVERLKDYAMELNVSNVLLPGRQPIRVVSDYLYAADVLIIPPTAAPLEKFGKTVLPFKLFPYLAAGRPIVVPDQADMRELLVDRENALLVQPDAPGKNAEVLAGLLSDESLQRKLSANATETSGQLTWEERAKKFKAWLKTR